jgi:hypothetical protein
VEVFDPASTRVYTLWGSESELLYDWRFTTNQFVLSPSPLRLTARIFFQLNTCGHSPYVTSSLTRGWVSRLQLLLTFASAFILRSESRRTHDHIVLSQIRDSPNLEARSPHLYPPGTGWPSYTPRNLVPFPSPFTTRRATVEVIRTLLHTLDSQSAMSWRVNSRQTEYKTQHNRLLKKWIYVCSTEVNRFTKCKFFCLPHIIVFDANLLKIILTSFFCCRSTNLSYNKSSLYRLRTDNTENKSRDYHPASSLARLLLPSNEL